MAEKKISKKKDSEKKIEKKKNPNMRRSNSIGQVQVNPGDNARYLRFALDCYELPPIDIADAEAVEERINWYFRHCIDCDIKPGVAGLCGALGIDRQTFYQWTTGVNREGTHKSLAKKAKFTLEQLMEQYMVNGKINPVSGIFLLKNHFGYTDKQEITIQPKKGLEVENQKQLEERYIEDIVEVKTEENDIK